MEQRAAVNAPAHALCVVSQFLAKKQVTTIVHPPHSPDLASADFYLFPKLKFHMKGTRYQSVSNIQQIVTQYLKTIPQCDFPKAFQNLLERYKACIDKEGVYVEA